MTEQRIIHGDDLLYRFFQSALAREPELYAKMPGLLIQTMSVWFPVDIYRAVPILIPWVVRDPECRGRKRADGLVIRPDEWSAPNGDGFARDDNSLVKSLPRSLTIRGPRDAHLDGCRLGKEFVASHIWRLVSGPQLASRNPLLNTFVPNLVWLPSQIAKLSDLENGPIQNALKSLSWSIYHDQEVELSLRAVVDEAWAMLPDSSSAVPLTQSAMTELNWFESNARFLGLRRQRLDEVIDALEKIARGEVLTRKVVATRYTEGLPHVTQERREALLQFLRRFA
jgi:hypothetical protein